MERRLARARAGAHGGAARPQALHHPPAGVPVPPSTGVVVVASLIVVLLGVIAGSAWSLRIQDEAPLTLVAIVRGEAWDSPLIPLLAEEIVKDEPGREAVLDRLLDLLLIATLRAWFARPEADAPRWYRAYADPVVGPALRTIHNNPAHPWTVAELAAAAGASRAALARRFNALVGEPPMTLLTGRRIALAADLLREPGATVGSVARQVGYGSPFALSAAFTRVRGISPQRHRAGSAGRASPMQ